MSKCHFNNKRQMDNGQVYIRKCPAQATKKLLIADRMTRLCEVHFDRAVDELKRLQEEMKEKDSQQEAQVNENS